MTSVDECASEYRTMCNTLATLRVFAALTPLEDDKKGRVFEIVNRLEDISTEHLKRHMEFLDLAEELRQILNVCKASTKN